MTLVILALFAAALIALVVWLLLRMRISPQERERRRRSAVNAFGRLADGNVTEANDETIFYSYSVGGVAYSAAQDITDLRDAMPASLEQFIGCPVTVKYATHNAFNSIVVCETWSGLRMPAPPLERPAATHDASR